MDSSLDVTIAKKQIGPVARVCVAAVTLPQSSPTLVALALDDPDNSASTPIDPAGGQGCAGNRARPSRGHARLPQGADRCPSAKLLPLLLAPGK